MHRGLFPRAEPDARHPGGRARARIHARLGRRHREHQGRDDRRLPRCDRARNRAHRRTREPDRRLPGRLARDDLRRAPARACQHVDDRRRAGRLPFRRAGDPRGTQVARAGREPRVLPRARGRWRWRPAAASTCSPGSSRSSPTTRSPASWQLLGNIDDPRHRERYREFEDWFKHTQAIPGAFYLWIVEHLFRDNELIAGKLEIAGERVELGRIEMPAVPARRGDRPHHATRSGLRARRLRQHAERADRARHDRRRPSRPVHGPRGAACALAGDSRRRARALGLSAHSNTASAQRAVQP